MDIKLQDIIEKIKKEGIEQARANAAEISRRAEKEAADIIDKAKKDAADIVKNASEKADKLKLNAENALKQASRDLLLSLKENIIEIFNAALKRKIAAELNPDFMAALILKVVDKWQIGDDGVFEVLANESDREKLERVVLEKVNERVKNGIVVKVNKGINAGFRLGIQGDDIYYDFTEESVFEVIKEFLTPSLTRILSGK